MAEKDRWGFQYCIHGINEPIQKPMHNSKSFVLRVAKTVLRNKYQKCFQVICERQRSRGGVRLLDWKALGCQAPVKLNCVIFRVAVKRHTVHCRKNTSHDMNIEGGPL